MSRVAKPARPIKAGILPKRQGLSMTSRERILAVLNREPIDRLPVDIWHTDEILQDLLARFGCDNDLDLYRAMGVDKIAWVFPIYHPPEGGATGSTHIGNAERSMWGTPLEEMQAGEALYREFGDAPLAGYDTPESLADYPYWPDPGRFDYDAMVGLARRAAEDFVVLGPWVSLFEIYCQMRGLEDAFIDVLTNPPLVQAALDRIEACQSQMMRRFLERAGDAVDLVFISDDMGSQNSLLMSLETWDTYFADRATGGGAIQDAITHLVNAGEWLVGPVTRVMADAMHRSLPGVQVEDTVHAIVRHGENPGVPGLYGLNLYQAPDEFGIKVVAERGTCQLDLHRQRWSYMLEPAGQWTHNPFPVQDRDEVYIRQANLFLDAVAGTGTPPCTLQEAEQTLRVNLAMLRCVDNPTWTPVPAGSAW